MSEEAGLRRANGSVAIIVQHEELYGQAQMRDGGQFLNVQLKTAVAIHADGALFPAGNAYANTGWNRESHTPKARGVEYALPKARPVRQNKYPHSPPRT